MVSNGNNEISTDTPAAAPAYKRKYSFYRSIKYSGQWFSLGTLVSSTNEIDRHDITEILLKVALNTTNQTEQTISPPICLLEINFICTCFNQLLLIFQGNIEIGSH
jgi:hypothetical protein